MKLLHRRLPIPIDRDVDGHSLVLPSSVIVAIQTRLPKKVGSAFHENVLYMAGVRAGPESVCLAITQPDATTWPGEYRTTPEAHAEAFRAMRRHGLEMLGQIHCHPGRSVEHSDGDDEHAVLLMEGYWSVVVPRYGTSTFDLRATGFHCYRLGAFRLLAPEAVVSRVNIVPETI